MVSHRQRGLDRGGGGYELPYEYNPYAEVAAGEMAKRSYRVLVMPYVQALSDREAQEVERFVRQGGWVVADVRPGVMDEHSNYVPERTFLRDLFGASMPDFAAVRSNATAFSSSPPGP